MSGDRLTKLLVLHRYRVIAVWVLLALTLRAFAPTWQESATDGDFDQLPSHTTTARAATLKALAFPDESTRSELVFVFARDETPLTIEDRTLALQLASAIRADKRFPLAGNQPEQAVLTEETPVIGPMLKNASGSAQRVVVRLDNDFMATDNVRLLGIVEQLLDEYRSKAVAGLGLGVSGSAAVGGDIQSAAAESLRNTHMTTILLVVSALVVIYRSPRLVLVPLLSIAVASLISIDLLSVLAAWSRDHPAAWPTIRIFTTTKIFVIVLLFGAGTDYCMFLIARYREERTKGTAQDGAVRSAVHGVGRALVASAMTTVLGLAMMGFAEFGKFAYSGPAIALSLLVTLAVCLTLSPALLATRLGQTAPTLKTPNDATPSTGVWPALTLLVLHKPGTLLTTSLLLALPLAWLGAQTPVNYDLFSELSPQRISRQGTRLLQRHFPPGELGPVIVLAQLPDGKLASTEGRVKIARLAKPLTEVPGVARIRSLDQPTGDPPGTVRMGKLEDLATLAAKTSPQTKATFVSQAPGYAGQVTRLSLILRDEPFSRQAVKTCEAVEQRLRELSENGESPWYGATFELTGPTAQIRDLQTVTQADRRKIEILVAGAVFLILVCMLRRPGTALYLIATVVLSYLVTLGLVGGAFHFLHSWSGEAGPWLGLDWKVPVFLFVILTAVGQDYNIYLVTRVFEEQRAHGPQEGLRRAMIQTGGIITSCGIVMAGTFVSMLTGSLRGMVELGTALSLGILLDTFVVRTVLVPAFLALVSNSERLPKPPSYLQESPTR